jgi:hypothetical protein
MVEILLVGSFMQFAPQGASLLAWYYFIVLGVMVSISLVLISKVFLYFG